MYERSVRDPEGFWAEQAEKQVEWFQKWDTVLEWDFHTADIKWFLNGKLNVSYNCLDRHVNAGAGDQTALIWQGNNQDESKTFSYAELLDQVCQFANALRALGVQKRGSRVSLYADGPRAAGGHVGLHAHWGRSTPLCFGAFSPDSLRDRIQDSACKLLITQDTGLRGAKNDIPMKTNADTAVAECPSIEHVVVVRRTGHEVPMQAGRDVWWHAQVAAQPTRCEPEFMDAEDPLFILYTSGSTGKPKGVLHTTGGYLVYAAMTHRYVFDYRPGDIYWCTADIGWVTGHSYIVYGPMANRATTMMFEGVPNYPDFGRFWQIVEQHKVNIFYTAPTALRALMKEGDAWPAKYDLSLRILGTVGEPIKSPEWHWYFQTIGQERCPIVDTWWQTETGGILITPLPGATKTKPGSATRPFFGVQPCLVDDQGTEVEGNGVSGNLCLKFPWPGIMRTVYGDHERFIQTYFSAYPGKYFSGDGCRRDEDGYYWITGRVDDVINVSGHRLGTAEIEGALGKHPAVAEAAVVGMPHDLKGQGIYAFVTLKTGQQSSADMVKELNTTVRQEIGPHATPDKVQFADGLPKTRSGKIMRRILRKIGEGAIDQLGDTSTLADPSVVDQLVDGRL